MTLFTVGGVYQFICDRIANKQMLMLVYFFKLSENYLTNSLYFKYKRNVKLAMSEWCEYHSFP